MEFTGLGTVIMFAVAAGLWFLYLVPTWLKRREYLSTERTAARLQQTIRVMAEAAETPEVLHVEATARAAAQQERAVRAEDRRRVAAERAARAAARVPASAPDAGDLRRRRIRRGRLVASLLMVAATVAGVVQVVLIVTTGAVPASWGVLAAVAAGACTAVAVQRRLDGMRAARPAERAVLARAAAGPAPAEAPEVADRGWTPVPLPRPRYLERPEAQPVAPRVDAAALLRAAAEEAERARRAAHDEPEVVPFRPRTSAGSAPAQRPSRTEQPASRGPAAATSSRFARMGLVDPADTAAPDLDEVLRRRRSAG